ncbi:ATP-binding cassette domain-containing protein, partial [Streptococcus suis]|uniref:ATP-binding cassette domain-containing protein n=1 Tax=Streptococcus suis TaxID=1307 RepID=UPI0029C4E5B4
NVRAAVASRQGYRLNFVARLDRLAEVARKAEAVTEMVGLAKRRDVMAEALSYGEQRKLEIALTVALEPKLVLLDEPCAGLNAEDTHAA